MIDNFKGLKKIKMKKTLIHCIRLIILALVASAMLISWAPPAKGINLHLRCITEM
jgi:hypothetical protein